MNGKMQYQFWARHRFFKLVVTFSSLLIACQGIGVNQIPVLKLDRSKYKPINVLKIRTEMDDKIVVHQNKNQSKSEKKSED